MKLDAAEIEQLVSEREQKLADWARAACVWENDWYGIRYHDDRQTRQDLDGVETVVSPDPYNTIQLLLRFVAGELRMEVPSLSAKEDDEDRSEMMEEWAVAFDVESNRQQGRNHINDMTWQSGVLARGMTQIIWIGDLLKRENIKGRLPIQRRHLDPRNSGIVRGAFGVDCGYHKYDATANYIKQMYPKFELLEWDDRDKVRGITNKEWKVIDYWYRHKGSIWHSVVIDHKFAKSPVKTDYPDVPFVEHYADGAPVDEEIGRSLSILHPIHETWKLKCDTLSRVATGLMYHYDPLMVATGSFTDQERQQLSKAGPGEIAFLRDGQTLVPFSPQPNVPMAQALLQMLQTGIDQATFNSTVYGDNSGGVTAGYAINSLAQSAKGRVNVIRQNIEAAVEAQYQLVFGLIETMAPEEGVEVYGRSARGDRGKPLKLTKKIIKGNYANNVSLVPEQPMDDTQRILAWNTLLGSGVVSKELMRNRVLNVQMPRDEETRVAVESTLQMPEMAQKAQLRALQKTYTQDDWELMIVGTPLQAVHEQEMQWREQKRQREEAAKAQREQQKLEKLLAEGKAHVMPDGTIMEGPPMMPPLPPGLEMMGGPLPPSGGNLLPPGAMPPDMSMQPPGLPGVPPQMAGQMTPDMLGLPPGTPPGTFDMLMGGQPPSEEELLRGMGALPPQI